MEAGIYELLYTGVRIGRSQRKKRPPRAARKKYPLNAKKLDAKSVAELLEIDLAAVKQVESGEGL